MSRLSEQKMREILSSSAIVIYSCRVDGDYDLSFVSDNVLSLFGYSVEECLEKKQFWQNIVHPEDYDHAFHNSESLFLTGYLSLEYRFLNKDGRYTWVQDEMRLLRDDSGVPVEIVGSWFDISKRKKAEIALKNSEGHFRALFESNPSPTIISDPAGVIYNVNPSFTATTGYAREEVVGRTSYEMGFWRDIEDRERMVSAIKEHGFIDSLEGTFYGKNNKIMRCIISSRAVEYDDEIRMISTVTDVTEERAFEEKLRRSDRLFRTLFEISPMGTIVTSTDGLIHLANPAFLNASGYTSDELLGQTVQELGFWKREEDRHEMLSAIRDKGYIDNLEACFYAKNNKALTCLVSSRVIELDGEIKILNVVVDITTQRAAEESMRQLEKAKSDFISTVAHELRTPLIAIVGYCELLENVAGMSLEESTKKEYLDIILSNAEVLNSLVDDLLDMGRIQIGRSLGITKQEVELRPLVDKIVATAKFRSPRHEVVVEECEGVPKSLWIDAGRITQVLHNLLSNAITYSPDGGVVKIMMRGEGEHVLLSVIDTGIGMSPEQAERIFDQFYRVDTESTKSLGLGLGLSIAKQIVSDHGGEFFVESSPGQGTTMTLKLPLI